MTQKPLLTTKLYIPPPRLNLVPRPRLIERLKAGCRGKLTLVSAPAGYGKTTLISDWVAQSQTTVAWLSLDEEDNNLARFLIYLIAALQQIEEDIGIDIQTMTQTTQSPQIEPLITMLINEIDACKLEFILVLDDYHLITNQAVYDAIDFLLDYQPPRMHLVLIGRVDPLISLSRLRVGGQITEIRQNDLRFTKAEVAAFLNDQMGLDLSEQDIAALEARTEGWIASLQLAALSLQDREDKQAFVTAFSGSHHYVIDYLVDEVMSRQPGEIQTFLYQTSILERFCAPLCDVLLDLSTSKQIIVDLEDANLFLISLDDERHWFRYHHLFADFLKKRLQENEPESVPGLHLRASRWFEQNGFIPEAVDHSLAAEDFEAATRLVEHYGWEMMVRNEFPALTKWIESMPEEFVLTRPWLCIFLAWMIHERNRFDIAEGHLLDAEGAIQASLPILTQDDEDAIRGQIAVIRSLMAQNGGNISLSIELAHQARELVPQDFINRDVITLALGLANVANGDLAGAIQALEEVRVNSKTLGNLYLMQVAAWYTGHVEELLGQLHRAADTYQEATELKFERGELKLPFASHAYADLGNILREWNQLEAAQPHLVEGIELAKKLQMANALMDSYATMARVLLAQGDLNGALDVCQKAEQTLAEVPNPEPFIADSVADCRVWLWLAQGNFTAVDRWAQECGLEVEDELDFARELNHITLARALVISGREAPEDSKMTQAQVLLTRLREKAQDAGWVGKEIEILVLQAMAFRAQNENEKALSALETALILAEPGGYVRTFVDEGEPMHVLLRQDLSSNIKQAYVDTLLTAFEPGEVVKQPVLAQPLVEPLTRREIEVLKLLLTELSGPEIARELMVSENTMRTHTKNIYSKLNVNSRRAAVRKVEELELL